MKSLTLQAVLKGIKEYFLMFVGMIFYAFAWIACIIPANGTGGGATGLSLVLCAAMENLFGVRIDIGTMTLIINGTLVVISVFLIGWKLGVKTIYCILLLPFVLNFFQSGLPAFQQWLIDRGSLPVGSVSVFGNLDPILLVIMGALISGVGIWLCLVQGGSTGGVDIVALVINKYHPINYGRVVIIHDSAVILASLLVGNGPDTVIYGFLFTIVFSYTTDALLLGNQQSNQLLVISRLHAEIADEIARSAHRGVTMLQGQGWYSKQPTQVVMVMCRKRETNDMLKIIKTIDPGAFISVTSVTGVYGKGFGMIGGGMFGGHTGEAKKK